MADGTPTAPESAGVQAFILQRQADLIGRAIDTIATCPADALAPELHRLSGTLGTYQLPDARAIVQEFESTVKRPDAAAAEIEAARAVALEQFRTIARSRGTDIEGESSP